MIKKGRICFLFLIFAHATAVEPITVVGAGYVGLVMSTVFATHQFPVNIVDINAELIDQLKQGKLYYQEKQLSRDFHRAYSRGFFSFFNDISAVENPGIVMICTDTPNRADGALDDRSVFSAVKSVLERNMAVKKICVKSTLQPGSMKRLIQHFTLAGHHDVAWAYNPEFMREGSAITDIVNLNPVIIGSDHESIKNDLCGIYSKVLQGAIDGRLMTTDIFTAEIIKLAWNGFSAMRIAYANELSRICAHHHGDLKAVMKGISWSEQLLPTQSIIPGCGYGGSCFPKDTLALQTLIESVGKKDSLITQTIRSNQEHIKDCIDKIIYHVAKPSKVVILGFSFKANTNDTRNSPTAAVALELLNRGYEVIGYDPAQLINREKQFHSVKFSSDPYDALEDADCIVIMNDHPEFFDLDLQRIVESMHQKIIFDFKNIYAPSLLTNLGFQVFNLGRND